MFMGIRVWDAVGSNFKVPEGSEAHPCMMCRELMYVQRSFIDQIIKRGVKHALICYTCIRTQFPENLLEKAEVHAVPEVIPELLGMLKTRQQ